MESIISKEEMEISSNLSAISASEHVNNISKFGVRYAGSTADDETVRYLQNEFQRFGLEVECETFKALCFEERKTELTITVPERRRLKSRAMAFSAATPLDGVTAELVHVGKRRYAEEDISGKIAIFDRDPVVEKDSYWEEVNELARGGVVAAIMANYKPWIFISTLESGFFDVEKRLLPITPKPIPAVVISSADALYLYDQLKRGEVIVQLVVDSTVGERETANVRAILRGTELENEKIIVCGHHDSEGTIGANDNGSGLAVMLEIARVLSKYRPRRTIEFLATGAEEVSSIGSWHYCETHKDELKNIRAVINVDMVGVGGDLYLIKEGKWPDKILKTPPWLYNFVSNIAENLKYKTRLGVCELGTSDEGRFLDAGVPALFVWKPGDEYYHSPQDVPERVDPNTLKVVAEIVSIAAWRLANAEDISSIISTLGIK